MDKHVFSPRVFILPLSRFLEKIILEPISSKIDLNMGLLNTLVFSTPVSRSTVDHPHIQEEVVIRPHRRVRTDTPCGEGGEVRPPSHRVSYPSGFVGRPVVRLGVWWTKPLSLVYPKSSKMERMKTEIRISRDLTFVLILLAKDDLSIFDTNIPKEGDHNLRGPPPILVLGHLSPIPVLKVTNQPEDSHSTIPLEMGER